MFETDSVSTVVRAVACALSVAAAPTGFGLAASIATCYLLFYPPD